MDTLLCGISRRHVSAANQLVMHCTCQYQQVLARQEASCACTFATCRQSLRRHTHLAEIKCAWCAKRSCLLVCAVLCQCAGACVASLSCFATTPYLCHAHWAHLAAVKPLRNAVVMEGVLAWQLRQRLLGCNLLLTDSAGVM